MTVDFSMSMTYLTLNSLMSYSLSYILESLSAIHDYINVIAKVTAANNRINNTNKYREKSNVFCNVVLYMSV